MFSNRTTPHCKQCGYELEGGEDTCPQCQFRPREKGLRLSMILLMIVVVMITITMIVPIVGPLLVRLAAVSFVLSLVTFLISFLATPHRLGSLFLRL